MFIGPFENGWGLSVISGYGTYSDADTYEVAVVNPEGELDYTHTNGDVLSYQTVADIEALKCRIESLYEINK